MYKEELYYYLDIKQNLQPKVGMIFCLPFSLTRSIINLNNQIGRKLVTHKSIVCTNKKFAY